MTQDTNQCNEDVWGFFHPLLQSGLYFSFPYYCSHKHCTCIAEESIQPLLVCTTSSIFKFKPSAKQLKVALSTVRRAYFLPFHTLHSLVFSGTVFFVFCHHFTFAAFWDLSRGRHPFHRWLLKEIWLLHLSLKHNHSCWPSWLYPWLLKRRDRIALRIQKYVLISPDLTTSHWLKLFCSYLWR